METNTNPMVGDENGWGGYDDFHWSHCGRFHSRLGGAGLVFCAQSYPLLPVQIQPEPKDLCSVWTPFADTILWRKGGRELTSEIWPFCLAILANGRESTKRYYFTLARILVWTNFMLYNIFVHDHRLDAWWCHDLNSRERPRTCILMGKLYPMISSSGLTLLDLVADLSHRTMLI